MLYQRVPPCHFHLEAPHTKTEDAVAALAPISVIADAHPHHVRQDL